ncbi:MAG: 3'-5' exoribonuclease domain-containing protein [Xenococcaceae cyanobacterium]
MKYFLDCEFIEDGKTIDLISIGIVCEDGREYYAINNDCKFHLANDWVWENVLKPIGISPIFKNGRGREPSTSQINVETQKDFRNKQQIKEQLGYFFNLDRRQNIEIWGEWCSYDWVAFCQIFGTMQDLPEGFPMRCRDIIQYAEDYLNILVEELPTSLETEGNHNALLGAKTVKQRYEYIEKADRVIGSWLRNSK